MAYAQGARLGLGESGWLRVVTVVWPDRLTSRQVKLSLFDIVLYIDDSGSMAFEERGERIDDLKLYVPYSPTAADTARSDQVVVGTR